MKWKEMEPTPVGGAVQSTCHVTGGGPGSRGGTMSKR